MAVGLPVVASDIDVLQETTGGYAVHVCGDSPDGYAAAIQHQLDSSALAVNNRLRAAREFATKYDWTIHARHLARIYDQVCC
jgi:glycosyltransferase involved in cell wall biosynthesis